MKVLLANPPCRIKINELKERFFVRAGSRWPFSVIKKSEDKPEYIPFPFYLAYTAAILEKKGHQVIVDDGVATNETEREFLEKTFQVKPEVILFETSTPTVNYDLKLVKKIKKRLKKSIICLAGTHVTTFFRQILKENPEVDYAFLAEYEINFAKFIQNLSLGKRMTKVWGIAYRENRDIVFQEPQLVDPLDQLPFPARHLFPNNVNADPTGYWDGFCQYKPAIQMHSSRGCPFRCNFCLWNQVMYRNKKYRVFSAKRVVDEMEDVVKRYGAREIYFDDDTFTANKNHVSDICREITKRELKIHWSVMGDAILTTKEMVNAMADAGCIGMKFGVESGNREILRYVGKPINFAKLKEFTNWCAKRRVKTHAAFTFGLSGETRETMGSTLNLAKSLDVDSVQFSITTPFPGTRYYDELEEKGLLNFNSWEEFDGSSSSVVSLENVSTKEVEDMYNNASSLWLKHKLKNPRWVLRQSYNSFRLIKGQGFLLLLKKINRIFELLLGLH